MVIKHKSKTPRLFIAVILFVIGGYILFVGVRSFFRSIIFTHPDRVNIILYNDMPTFVSIGITDPVHYKGVFKDNISVVVPGGYGTYDIYSIGKLAKLEKKPEILKKTFSSVTSTYIDYFFIEKGNDTRLSLKDIFFPEMTNASFIDRIFLSFLLNRRGSDYGDVYTQFDTKDYETNFFKKYGGYFYKKELRLEGKTLGIRYRTSSAAKILSRIFEGEGIHVVDLSYDSEKVSGCILTKNSSEVTKTEEYIKDRFGCSVKKGDTDGQDMVLQLGEKLEKNWE